MCHEIVSDILVLRVHPNITWPFRIIFIFGLEWYLRYFLIYIYLNMIILEGHFVSIRC